MDREARVSVGPRRNHDGGHQDEVRGGAQALPNKAGGCWKELPETLAKKKAMWNTENEDRRCFMWCVLAHCLRVEGLNKTERKRTVSCSGPFFYPKLAGRQGLRPLGWQPALADAGVDFSGLPTDCPMNFDDIEAFKLRNAGRVEVFVFVSADTTTSSSSALVRHTVLLLLQLASRQELTREPPHKHRRSRRVLLHLRRLPVSRVRLGLEVVDVHGQARR